MGDKKNFLNEVLENYDAASDAEAGQKLLSFIRGDENVDNSEIKDVGDLLSLGYSEATILVHDAARQKVGGLPLGCFLVATRMSPQAQKINPLEEDSALILLRVVGHAYLSNQAQTEQHRLDAGIRASDTPQNWDDDNKTDQFTLDRLRFAGVRCNVIGTFRMMEKESQNDASWELRFGADISNFYSGQGMKVYKPLGRALRAIVNFPKPAGDAHPLSGNPVEIGRVRYSSTEISVKSCRENVAVGIEPTDLLARRTALFGMSRSGKSNTIKTIAAAVFKLRNNNPQKGKIGQLIFDLNGEYCNDNPQDSGCLRNVWRDDDGKYREEDVVTYGFFDHPNDPQRRLIKVNFFGGQPDDWNSVESVDSALAMMRVGKELIDEHFHDDTAQYVKNFLNTSLDMPTPQKWEDKGEQIRYQRCVVAYRAILAQAGFKKPKDLELAQIRNLFGADLRKAMRKAEGEYERAADVFEKSDAHWDELFDALSALRKFMGVEEKSSALEFVEFNRAYQKTRGKSWSDDKLDGILSLLARRGGYNRVRGLRDRHSIMAASDYSVEITEALVAGKLVIVDQSIGSPLEIRHSAERIMWALFDSQKLVFTNPPRDKNGDLVRDEATGNISPPPDVVVYVEEAHNLLPAKSVDLNSIWSRVAKEGSKFRIGMVFSTQEPSSILSNILKNTDNWFVAHLNNQDETRELKKYYDFEAFVEQILRAPDTGFLRMRCLSNPYIVPIQVNRFDAPRAPDGEGESSVDRADRSNNTSE